MTHILVTNDDGVYAPGLLALAQEMKKIGDVSILAPSRNWSASGHVKTMHRPLRVKTAVLADGTRALASDGAPSDCVALALLGMIEEKIDIVVSGINPYANLGHDITYSGTVTAAMEAVIGGIPGFAFSLNQVEGDPQPADYGPAAHNARQLVERALEQGVPENTLLNVNIPNKTFEEINGWMVTRQGLRVYRDKLDMRKDPRGRPYYWIGGDYPTGINEPGTDFGALAAGYVSITPISLDLTDQKGMKKWAGLNSH